MHDTRPVLTRAARTHHAWGWRRVLALAILLLLAATGPAPACPEDGDGDGVCDADDNCPALANAGQEDLDVDAAGDVCDDADAVLNLNFIQLKRNTSGRGDKSSIKLLAFFLTQPASGDVFDASAGFTLRARDALDLDLTTTFLAADCITVKGKGKCKSSDKSLKATFKPLRSTPETIKAKIVMKRLGLEGPFVEPVSATLTQTGTAIDRFGEVADCVLGVTGLKCRQF